MATAAMDICNLALGRIGHTRFITGMDDGSREAQVATLHFEQTRDAVLEALAWKFADKRKVLALVAGVTREDWNFIYAYPTDCLVARAILEEGVRNPTAAMRIPFKVEANDDATGQILLTDQQDAELSYTVRHTAIPVWSASFVDALAWRLAAEFAMAIKKDPKLGQAMGTQYSVALLTAAAVSGNQGQPDVEPVAPSIAARW